MNPRIVIACDSFKGSLSSAQVNDSVAMGISSVLQHAYLSCVAVADGGEGTMEMLVEALHGKYHTCHVHDPLMRSIDARYGVVIDQGTTTAIIEMAAASGLPLLSGAERNPSLTTTYGTGELIADAYACGCRRFIVGIGGSATNDGGTGMLRALGVRWLDSNGEELPAGGGALTQLHNIDMSNARRDIMDCTFTIICDVDNPLTGTHGASHVFGPQKGASESDVMALDEALTRYSACVLESTGKNVAERPGAGAAGGMGAAFMAFFNATLRPGIETTLDTIHFADIINGADLVITGEGRIDRQTLHGKTPYGILRKAISQGIPTVALGGAVEDTDMLCNAGFSAVLSIQQGAISLQEAMQPEVARKNIADTAAQIVRLIYTTRP